MRTFPLIGGPMDGGYVACALPFVPAIIYTWHQPHDRGWRCNAPVKDDSFRIEWSMKPFAGRQARYLWDQQRNRYECDALIDNRSAP
jgi:hypothetical protein